MPAEHVVIVFGQVAFNRAAEIHLVELDAERIVHAKLRRDGSRGVALAGASHAAVHFAEQHKVWLIPAKKRGAIFREQATLNVPGRNGEVRRQAIEARRATHLQRMHGGHIAQKRLMRRSRARCLEDAVVLRRADRGQRIEN